MYSKSQSRCSHAAQEDHGEKQVVSLQSTQGNIRADVLQDPTWRTSGENRS